MPTDSQANTAKLLGRQCLWTRLGYLPFSRFPVAPLQMRISPLPTAYRNADAACLLSAVTAAILTTHRHPEAINFAACVAAAVQYCPRAHFDAALLLEDLIARWETKVIRSVLKENSKTAVALMR
jgi:ADP-ribosylglycohydrolase